MSCGVYKITNKLTGECYIGSSKNIEKRWSRHKKPSTWKRQPNNPLYKAFQEYGIADFQFDILEECSEDNLKQLEDKYIRELRPAYNHNRAFIQPEKRQERHLETSLRYAENHKDDPVEKERRNKNSNAWKERNREKAREAVRRWKARKKLEAEQNKQK